MLAINFTKARFTLRVVKTVQRLDITNKYLQLPAMFSLRQSSHNCREPTQLRAFMHFLGSIWQTLYIMIFVTIFSIKLSFTFLWIQCFHFDSLVTAAQINLSARYLCILLVQSLQSLTYFLQTYHFSSLVTTAYSTLRWGYLWIWLAQFHKF